MTLTDKIMDLSTIWKQAALVFPHFDRYEENWDNTYREFLNRDIRTRTDREHFLLLAEFINRLGDGHTDVGFSKEMLDSAGYLPFAFAYSNGSYYVNGARVLGVDERPVAQILDQAAKYVDRVGDYVPRLGYILPFLLDGKHHTLETEEETVPFELLPNRPEQPERKGVQTRMVGDALHVVLDDFLHAGAADTIRKALEENKPAGVILDIRENIGGMTKFAADIAQLFISGTFGGCQKWTRTMKGVEYAASSQVLRMTREELEQLSSGNSGEEVDRSLRIAKLCQFHAYEDEWGESERKAVFDGPLVLLTSRRTVSAAEDFTAFFKSCHRAAIIGEPTCGTSGTPLLISLSSGWARVCSVGYRLKDGTPWLGVGIQPDIPAACTPQDMKQGKDPVMERAMEELQ